MSDSFKIFLFEKKIAWPACGIAIDRDGDEEFGSVPGIEEEQMRGAGVLDGRFEF